jgi:hypothetical protein
MLQITRGFCHLIVKIAVDIASISPFGRQTLASGQSFDAKLCTVQHLEYKCYTSNALDRA